MILLTLSCTIKIQLLRRMFDCLFVLQLYGDNFLKLSFNFKCKLNVIYLKHNSLFDAKNLYKERTNITKNMHIFILLTVLNLCEEDNISKI